MQDRCRRESAINLDMPRSSEAIATPSAAKPETIMRGFRTLRNRRYSGSILTAIAALGAMASASAWAGSSQPAGFRWESSLPLITPPADGAPGFHGVKDPSIVYHDGKYHVFLTTATSNGWGVAYT